MINTIVVLIVREWQKMLSEPSRITGIILQPLIFLGIFGLGFHKSFSWNEAPTLSYSAYFFPGILALVVLFASIFSSLTLVDDKKQGFFRYAVIGPHGLKGALIGKVLATASLGFCQASLFLVLSYFFSLPHFSLLSVLFTLLIGSIAFGTLGTLFAWVSPSSSAFHALMSILLIPMWILSGAMFPLDNGFLPIMNQINPMAFLVNALRSSVLSLGPDFIENLAKLLIFSFLVSVMLIVAIKRKPIE